MEFRIADTFRALASLRPRHNLLPATMVRHNLGAALSITGGPRGIGSVRH
jgi:hypothetical protein